MKIGRWAYVLGKPMILATDAEAGDEFRLHSLEATTLITGPGRIRIGDDVFINSGVRIESQRSVTIGTGTMIAYGVVITDTDSHGIGGNPTRIEPVTIGDGCWIGARAIILPGVAIGRRAVVAVGAVVTRDVPEDALVAGVPARLIRTIDYAPGQTKAAQ